jgi:hypothetical protein
VFFDTYAEKYCVKFTYERVKFNTHKKDYGVYDFAAQAAYCLDCTRKRLYEEYVRTPVLHASTGFSAHVVHGCACVLCV